jgi:hypothetical protein
MRTKLFFGDKSSCLAGSAKRDADGTDGDGRKTMKRGSDGGGEHSSATAHSPATGRIDGSVSPTTVPTAVANSPVRDVGVVLPDEKVVDDLVAAENARRQSKEVVKNAQSILTALKKNMGQELARDMHRASEKHRESDETFNIVDQALYSLSIVAQVQDEQEEALLRASRYAEEEGYRRGCREGYAKAIKEHYIAKYKFVQKFEQEGEKLEEEGEKLEEEGGTSEISLGVVISSDQVSINGEMQESDVESDTTSVGNNSVAGGGEECEISGEEVECKGEEGGSDEEGEGSEDKGDGHYHHPCLRTHHVGIGSGEDGDSSDTEIDSSAEVSDRSTMPPPTPPSGSTRQNNSVSNHPHIISPPRPFSSTSTTHASLPTPPPPSGSAESTGFCTTQGPTEMIIPRPPCTSTSDGSARSVVNIPDDINEKVSSLYLVGDTPITCMIPSTSFQMHIWKPVLRTFICIDTDVKRCISECTNLTTYMTLY